MKNNVLVPELSRPLKVDKISAGGLEEHIIASPAEREALAKRFGLVDLPRFEAFLNVDHAENHMLEVSGKISADVVQECVVSLDSLPAHISDTFSVLFAPSHVLKDEGDGPLADLGDADPPEPIENGMIDLGELAVQHLAMALDPYPRKEGASLAQTEFGGKGEGAATQNPFAKLKLVEKK